MHTLLLGERHVLRSIIHAVEVWYSGKNRSQVVYYDDCGDGAAWTGV